LRCTVIFKNWPRILDTACVGESRGVYSVLVGKPEVTRPLGRPRCRWEDNIKMDLQDVRCGALPGLIWLRTGTDGGHMKYSNEPSGSIKCREFLD
jgi:hypothetical protein